MEGFGFVFLEAMAYGRPVIAGNQDASIEVVRHGETGLVVDPSSVTELVNAIERLLSDAGLRRQMGARAMEVAASDFSYSRFRDTFLGHLRDVGEQPEPRLRHTLGVRRSQ
jgi:glycosyltransferase involved in cell wall biosynthesis